MSNTQEQDIELVKEMIDYFADITAYKPEVAALTAAISALEKQGAMIEVVRLKIYELNVEADNLRLLAQSTDNDRKANNYYSTADSVRLVIDHFKNTLTKLTKISEAS